MHESITGKMGGKLSHNFAQLLNGSAYVPYKTHVMLRSIPER
jgi:hypothetical protein